MPESPTLTLYYFILGDDPNLISSVKIETTKTIDALKAVILAKHGSRFNHVLAEELGLWAVSILGDETFVESIKKLTLEPSPLPPLKKLSNVFQDPLGLEHVHIIVKPPPPKFVSLNCCFLGQVSGFTFVVEIEAIKSVDALAQVIRTRVKDNPELDATNVHKFQLWKISVAVPVDQDAIESMKKYNLADKKPLQPLDELSEVFQDPPLQKHIHIVVKPLLPRLDLKCYVLGDHANLIFSVEIGAMNTINMLKEVIRAKSSPRFDHIKAHTLQLWKVSIPIKQIPKKISKLNLVDEESLQSPGELSKFLLDSLPGHVHIVVKPPPPSDTPHPLQVARENSFKSRKKGAPSTLGAPEEFADLQKNGHFACARPPSREPTLPFALMDPIFAKFIEDCGTVKPTEKAYQCAKQLRAKMNEFYSTEAFRGDELRTALEILDIKLKPGPVKKYCTDGHILCGPHLTALLELKNEIGSQGAEPSLQALLYYDEFAQAGSLAADVSSVHPCFIITLAGPRLAFVGCALTDRSTMETFSAVVLDFHSTNSSAYLNLARHLTALKTVLDDLHHRYSEAAPQTRPALPLRTPSVSPVQNDPRPAPADPIFPHPTTFTRFSDGSQLSFKYVAGLEGRALLFEGRTEHFDHICIKFVRRYGRVAHLWCAEHGFAPKLLGFEALSGGWFMVAMELLDSGSWTTLDLDEVQGDKAELKERILNSIIQLHQQHMVHGDIRCTNVMVDTSDRPAFMLIDFDWAGLVEKVDYPEFINIDAVLGRPPDVRYGLPILPQHDIAMIENMFL